MTATTGQSSAAAWPLRQASLRQTWVISPAQDALLVIAAPLLVLVAALATFNFVGAEAATALIITTHIVLTVAHHLPTFIRVYGDVELFRRFKWSFVLAPVVPLTICAVVLGYINYKGYPVEYFLYLYIMLVLWDPWHFLRQHYGFMRIYDRQNAAPRRLAAHMDLALSVAWFVFILLASGAWLAGLLRDLDASVHVPLIAILPDGFGALLVSVARDLALLTTLIYAGYLLWCRSQGYFVSVAKLLLCAATFAVMYLAYTPNDWILAAAPGWTFQVGFAVIGIVHMTQYLAIVWRYNRGLANRPGRARSGWFRKLHARGGWLIAAGYVLVCLLYGELVTTEHQSRWIMSVLLPLGFTSTLLHYYFDGFIWKIRHQENREALSISDHAADHAGHSWSAARRATAGTMLLRQLAYFGLPMLLLTLGAFAAWSSPTVSYIEHMHRAQLLGERGDLTQARREAMAAYEAMERELPRMKTLAALDGSSAHHAELAFLVYNHSYYRHVLLPGLEGRQVLDAERVAHRQAVVEASRHLEQALLRGQPLGHPGRPAMTHEDGVRTLASWRRMIESPIGHSHGDHT